MKPDLKIVVSNPPPRAPQRQASPEQVEMPFAVVNGEPMTQLPRDLYIPPQALEIFLEAFEGPLDLLLYLIRRQNVDILNIPIAEITRQYTQYIELMQELQLELAGEYLLMAATLAEIKSRMLLPRPPAQASSARRTRAPSWCGACRSTSASSAPPRDIDLLPRLERDVWQASAELRDRPALRALPQVTLQEMLLAFKEVAVRAAMFAHHHVQREPLSVRERMSNILAALEQGSFVEFAQPVHPRGRARRRDGGVHRDARADARGSDRDHADRAVRAAARARRGRKSYTASGADGDERIEPADDDRGRS